MVTGAGGFIGSHLTERLAALGAQTRALVHYNSNSSWGWLATSSVKDEVEVIAGDIRDRDSLLRATKGVEVIFHLAALIAIPYSYHTPLSYLRTNVEGTVNILQAAMDYGAELVVHTSTSEVYGTARYVPMDEGHPLNAQSPYSASKISADAMAQTFHHSFGLPVAIVRPFNTFGPRQSARAVIPAIITQVLTQPKIHLGNLEPTRDFNFVADIVDGFIKVAKGSSATGEVVNIGSGVEVSIGDLTTAIQTILGKDIPVALDEERTRPSSSEVTRLCADNTRAREVYGWKPQHTLEQGLSKTIEWIESNLGEFPVGTYAI